MTTTAWSSEQANFLRAVTDTDDHLFLRATAGSGKTRTLTEAATRLETSLQRAAPGADTHVTYFAYNAHTASAARTSLPPDVRAVTFHAHGLNSLRDLHRHTSPSARTVSSLYLTSATHEPVSDDPRGRTSRRNATVDLTLDPGKAERCAALLLSRTDPPVGGWNEQHVRVLAQAFTVIRETRPITLRTAGRAWLALNAERSGTARAEHRFADLIHQLEAVQTADFLDTGRLDYTDMLWLPVHLCHHRGSVAAAVIDEAQDLTPLRWAYVDHVTNQRGRTPGRVICGGDPEQTIYRFAGVDGDGMAHAQSRLHAVAYPLSVSFRCPSAVVTAARNVSSFIRPAATASHGEVSVTHAHLFVPRAGQTILARSHAELTALIPLLNAHQLTAVFRTTPSPDPLGQPAGETRSDLIDHHALQSDPNTSGHADPQASTDVQQGPNDQPSVVLSTVHAAKGQQYRDVVVLHPERMNSSTDPEERALLFVALTRSTHALTLVVQDVPAGETWLTPGHHDTGPDIQQDAPAPAAEKARDGPFGPDLFTGSDSVLCRDLRRQLTSIQRSSRPALRTWADTQLTSIADSSDRGTVLIDAAVLQRALTGHRLFAQAVPNFDRQPDAAVLSPTSPGHASTPDTAPASAPDCPAQTTELFIVDQNLGRWMTGRVDTHTQNTVTVRSAERQFTFDTATGELAGESFDPLNPFLKASRPK